MALVDTIWIYYNEKQYEIRKEIKTCTTDGH